MLPSQLHDNLDTRSLYGERPYGRTFKSLLTITYVTLLVLRSAACTAVLATRQLRSYIESLSALDMTLIRR